MNLAISGERSMRKSATFDQRMVEDSMGNADEQIPGKPSGTTHQKLASSFPQWGKAHFNNFVLH